MRTGYLSTRSLLLLLTQSQYLLLELQDLCPGATGDTAWSLSRHPGAHGPSECAHTTWKLLEEDNHIPLLFTFWCCTRLHQEQGKKKKIRIFFYLPYSDLSAVALTGSAFWEARRSSLGNVVANFQGKHGAERQKKWLSTVYFILPYNSIWFLPLIHWDGISKVPLAMFCPACGYTRNVSTTGEGLSEINLYFFAFWNEGDWI